MNRAVTAVLRDEVLRANQAIPRAGLATLPWGNVSGIDRDAGVYVIKPSGVSYDDLTAEQLVVVDLEDGRARALRRDGPAARPHRFRAPG